MIAEHTQEMIRPMPRSGGEGGRSGTDSAISPLDVKRFLFIMSAKRLQLLKEAVRSVSRVAVLWNPALSWHPAMLKEVRAAAPFQKAGTPGWLGQIDGCGCESRSERRGLLADETWHSECSCPEVDPVAESPSGGSQ